MKRNFISEDSTEGEAKINISLKYQLDLLEIIQNCNNFYRIGEGVGMSKEVEILFEGIIDKIPPGKIEEHETTQKKVILLRGLLFRLVNKYELKDASKPIKKEYAYLNVQLINTCRTWKQEIIKIMSKAGMLVTQHQGIGGAISN